MGETSRSGSLEVLWMGEMVVVIIAIVVEDVRLWEGSLRLSRYHA